MPEEQPEVEQTEEVTEPKTPKKSRGRPKGSKNKKKKAKAKVETVEAVVETPVETQPSAQLAALEKIATTLGALSERMDKIEESVPLGGPQQIVARGPNAPTTNQRAMQELGYQTPGPARNEKTDAEINKERRDAIYADREARGRRDREVMPSGVVASVGNKQRRNPGATRIIRQP